MLGTELLYKTFNEVREEYNYPPAVLELHHDNDKPFYICNMRVFICTELIESVPHLRAVLRHELGHPHIAPITIENAKRHLQKIREILPTDRMYILTKIANVIWDMIVDASLENKYPGHTLTSFESVIKMIREKGVPKNYGWNILVGFYNCLLGRKTIAVPEKYQRIGEIAYGVVRSNATMDKKVFRIASLFANEAKKESDTLDELEKFLNEAGKLLRRNLDKIVTIEEITGGSELVKKRLLEIVKKEDTGIFGWGLGGAFGVELDKYEYYKSKARKNIIFRVKGTTKQITKNTYKDALLNWTPDDPVESLEIEESLLDSGILIPEITTLQFDKKVKHQKKEIPGNVPKTVLAVDTSGSMPAEDTVITIFSFVEAAKSYNIPIGLCLFHSEIYGLFNFTEKYEELMKKVYNNYQSGGTSLAEGINGIEKIVGNTTGNLIIFITDWYDINIKTTAARLAKLGQTNKVITLAITSYGDLPNISGVKMIPIFDHSQLTNLTIDFLNDYMVDYRKIK